MFPLDRLAIVGSSVERIGDLGFGSLPDSLRLVEDGPPRLGVVGLALGAALSSWVEYRLLRGALEWRIGRLAPMTSAGHWSLIAAAASGVLAAGIRSVAQAHDLPTLVAIVAVCAPVALTYLAITTTMAVPEATALTSRVRTLVLRRR